MSRPLLLAMLVCLASPLATPPAHAIELTYRLYVLGVPAADATLGYQIAASSYQLALSFRTTGIADLFVGDHLEERTSGRLPGDQPAPTEYSSRGRLHGLDRVVIMTWHDGTPVLSTVAPPNSTEREDVPAAELARTMDPLDAIVLLLRDVARTGRCEGTARAYDGRRLQLLEARTGGEEDLPASGRSSFSGHALRCEFTDRTLGGFRLGSGRGDDLREHRGTIWLAPLVPGGPKLPVRASVQTRWLGDAMIYLTSTSP